VAMLINKFIVSRHYPSSFFHLKHTTFRRLDSVSVFWWNLLSWAQSIELVPVSGSPSVQSTQLGAELRKLNSVHYRLCVKIVFGTIQGIFLFSGDIF
jgi:hypothetical protein